MSRSTGKVDDYDSQRRLCDLLKLDFESIPYKPLSDVNTQNNQNNTYVQMNCELQQEQVFE